MKTESMFSEQTRNVVENLACRLAEKTPGQLAPHHLLPYLPMSLALIESCLLEMADASSIVATDHDGIRVFEFPGRTDGDPCPGPLAFSACVGCAAELPDSSAVLCGDCAAGLHAELDRLAERIGWPARAVYEHEILYLAAAHPEPVPAETLASRSRYTLRSMRRKLERLCLDRRARQKLDTNAGVLLYEFPALVYPQARYRANMAAIRRYPASISEEIELKIVRIVLTLAALLLLLFVLAFVHVPFPVLVAAFLIGGPLAALRIWRHRDRAPED